MKRHARLSYVIFIRQDLRGTEVVTLQ